jgi:hypothetical protein
MNSSLILHKTLGFLSVNVPIDWQNYASPPFCVFPVEKATVLKHGSLHYVVIGRRYLTIVKTAQ